MRLGLCALALAVIASCDRGPRPAPPAPRPPLYERLGGIAALRAVVDEMATLLAADPALAAVYLDTDFRIYKRRLLAELCGLAGGPCRHSASPAGPAVSDGAAGGWLAHLETAAVRIGLPAGARAELMARLVPRAAELAVGSRPPGP